MNLSMYLCSANIPSKPNLPSIPSTSLVKAPTLLLDQCINLCTVIIPPRPAGRSPRDRPGLGTSRSLTASLGPIVIEERRPKVVQRKSSRQGVLFQHERIRPPAWRGRKAALNGEGVHIGRGFTREPHASKLCLQAVVAALMIAAAALVLRYKRSPQMAFKN